MELDRFDKHILEILTHEDVNLNELSERVNLSVSSVHRRIKHLIDHNIISGLKREINYQKLGFSLHVLLQVSLSKHDSDTFAKFLEELESIPEVINAFWSLVSRQILLSKWWHVIWKIIVKSCSNGLGKLNMWLRCIRALSLKNIMFLTVADYSIRFNPR